VFTKEIPSTEGYLSVSPDNLTSFTYAQGTGPSDAESIALIGANLQGNLTVTMPTGFEVSSNGSTYSATLSLTPSNGSLQQMLYVRLAANLTEGSYNGTMTLTSGSTTQNVTLGGEVTEGTTPTMTQTLNLTSGTNWWTPNVDMDGAELLSLLENGLGTNGVMIIAQDGTSVTNSTYGWSGSLTAIEMGKLYMIQVSADCDFSIEGAAAPTDYNITLYPGNNWLGFFGTQSMPVNTALANLTATIGDIIIAQDGSSATYSTYGWGGSLTSLVPGEGYIYNSKANTTQTFTFPLAK